MAPPTGTNANCAPRAVADTQTCASCTVATAKVRAVAVEGRGRRDGPRKQAGPEGRGYGEGPGKAESGKR